MAPGNVLMNVLIWEASLLTSCFRSLRNIESPTIDTVGFLFALLGINLVANLRLQHAKGYTYKRYIGMRFWIQHNYGKAQT